jgi:hypothetical protein
MRKERMFHRSEALGLLLAVAILGAVLVSSAVAEDPPWATQAGENARVALEAIDETDTPEDVYAAFAEFCRLHFGAKAEPLVNELFGEDIELVQASTWSHISENSASLAWETNVPCYTYVEYGLTAAYGSATDETDRAYYQHLHQIKGLDVNTTYHYRLVAEDEWGNTFTTADATFTTTAVQGAIYVPGQLSGPPYILNTAGATYIVTQDITSVNNAIKVTAANITLDLNGHTVKFGENATSSSYCHGIWGQSCDNLKVVNGKVVQGDSALLEANTSGTNFNGLYLGGASTEVAGMVIEYDGPQAWGYTGNYNTGDLTIHHNVFIDKGVVVTSRHGSGVRPLGFRYPPSTNTWEIHNNLVKRTRQNGLPEAFSIHNNEIYIDSWPINSFAIQPNSAPGIVGGDHYDNKIFGTGFNVYGFGWAHEELNIFDNFIHFHGYDLSDRWIEEESWGDINMLCGMRVTNYSPGGQVRNDLSYWDNTIVIRGSENCEIRGTEFYTDETIENLIFFDNHVRVEALDAATTRVACVDAQGYFQKVNSKPCYYINNLFESNMYHVRFGDAYGKGLYHMFENCEFVRLGDRSDYHTFCFDGAYWNWGHVLTDCVFNTGTAPDDVYWKNCNSASWYAIAWTLDLTTAANADVEIKDKDDNVVFDGTADGDGLVSIGLEQYRVHPLEWLPTDPDGSGRNIDSANKLSHQKQQFNDYTVTVTDGVDTNSTTITMDQAKSLTLMPSTSQTATTLIVDFGDSAQNNAFDFSDWENVYVGPYTSYSSAGPDGIVGGHTGAYCTAGVNGSAETFEVGDKIIVTWYNTSASAMTFTPRLSFTDPNYPGGEYVWYYMAETTVPAGESMTTEFTFDATSAGTYNRVHVSRSTNGTAAILLDKIELEAAAEDPPPPAVELVVNFGDSAQNNAFDFSDWENVYTGPYTSYSDAGPDGIVGGNTGGYCTAGVNGSAETFVAGDKFIVTWYNTEASGSVTFTPRISFDGTSYPGQGGTWYTMDEITILAGESGSLEFTFDGTSAGTYSRVHVCRGTNGTAEALLDKIEFQATE